MEKISSNTLASIDSKSSKITTSSKGLNSKLNLDYLDLGYNHKKHT